MHKRTLLLFVSSLILFSSIVTASVGIGGAPSKVNYTVEGGETIVDTYLFYNTGTDPVAIHILPEGDIAPFTTITPTYLNLLPEPEPLKLPPKNGKTVRVRYHIPPRTNSHTYTGMIAASGRAGKILFEGENDVKTNFDNLISIGLRVTIYAQPTPTWWKFITPKHVLGSLSILLILTSIFLFYKRYIKTGDVHLQIIKKK